MDCFGNISRRALAPVTQLPEGQHRVSLNNPFTRIRQLGRRLGTQSSNVQPNCSWECCGKAAAFVRLTRFITKQLGPQTNHFRYEPVSGFQSCGFAAALQNRTYSIHRRMPSPGAAIVPMLVGRKINSSNEAGSPSANSVCVPDTPLYWNPPCKYHDFSFRMRISSF